MKKLIYLSLILMLLTQKTQAQAPENFNYQAVIRDNTGELIINQAIRIRIAITNDTYGGTIFYHESHNVTTNNFGLIDLNIGSGTSDMGDFTNIDWGTSTKYLQIEIDESGGTNYIELGTFQLLSVPYALFANVASSAELLGYEGVYSTNSDTLFVVKDHSGKVVFVVFPDGAQLIVNEDAKGKVGGFAISGRSPSKAVDVDILRVTADSTRVYINDTVSVKGKVGGFAISGRSPSKNINNDLLLITADSTRIYVNNDPNVKGKVGGFAISGRSPSKGTVSSLMDLTQDNYFIGHEAGINTTTGLYNSFFGYEAGYLNTEGEENIFIGFESGYSNIDGYENVFIGNGAGNSNGSGYDNIIIGNYAGYHNDTASYNVFIGNSAGYENTFGSSNVFIGDAAGEFNTIGEANIFLGDWAGARNTEGNENVFLGNEAGWSNTFGNYNVFLGTGTGYSNLTAEENVFLGNVAGYSNTTGSWNIFIGSETGYSNTIGEANVFIGDDAGFENTEGNNNVFIGDNTGNMNELGENNIFIGSETGLNNISGNWNCFLGSGAGFNNIVGFGNIFIGDEAGHSNENGYDNVYVGSESGYLNIDGSNNIFIGTRAGFFETDSNKLYIENSDADSTDALIYGDFDKDLIIINYSLGIGKDPESNELEVEGEASKTIAGGWIANSDKRIKTDIQDIKNAGDILLKLRPIKFKYTDYWRSKHTSIKDQYYYNFIAQEYQQVFPESVKGSGEYIEGDSDEILQLDSYKAQIVTIKAVQDLIKDNKEQQTQIEKLEAENYDLQQRLKKLEELILK